MRQVIAGQAAVELRKLRADEIGLLVSNAAGRAVNLADAPGLRTQCVQSRIVHRLADEALAAQQHVVQRQHVVARLAVGAAALAAGVGVDHAAQRRPVGGGQLGGEEEAVRPECGVELVLHHAGLGTHPAFLDVDLQNAVHVPRQVHHQPMGERLAVGARAAAARCQRHRLVGRLAQQRGHALHVLGVLREDGGLRCQLVERVVSGEQRAGGVVVLDLADKAAGAQVRQKLLIDGGQLIGWAGQGGDGHGTGGQMDRRRRGSGRDSPTVSARARPLTSADRPPGWKTKAERKRWRRQDTQRPFPAS